MATKGSDLKSNPAHDDKPGRRKEEAQHALRRTLGSLEHGASLGSSLSESARSAAASELAHAEEDAESSWYKRTALKKVKEEASEVLGQDVDDYLKHGPLTPASSWRRKAKHLAKQFVRNNKKFLIVTLVINLVVAAFLLVLALIGPLKHIHFETVMRTVNFARFQLAVRKQFGRVIFEASVLTQDSVGTFRNSPLVRQIRLALPDKQLKQLGSSDRVHWDFWPNGSFGDGLAPLRESLRGVIIDGQRYYLDDFAREQFNGKTYAQLTTREKMTINRMFLSIVMPKMNEFMKLAPRHVRWNPMIRLKQKVGFEFVKWLNRARQFSGLPPPQARALNADQTVERVWQPRAGPQSAIAEINEGAEEAQKDYIESAKTGKTPGQVRSRLAARAKTISNFSDVVFAVTASCVVREIAKMFTTELSLERQSQAARFAADLSSTSDQQKAGAGVGEAFGAANSMWDARGFIPDAVTSTLYNASTGAQAGLRAAAAPIPWLDPSLALSGAAASAHRLLEETAPLLIEGPLAGILKKLGINIGGRALLDGVCAGLMNQWVQYGITAVELIVAAVTLGSTKGVTAGIKAGGELLFHAAVGYGLGEFLGFLVKIAIDHYARLYFTGLEQGAERFDAGYVAQNSVAQVSNRGVTYGRPLTQEETNAAQEVAMGTLRAEDHEKSFKYRYFAIDNPTSLLGLTVAKIPSSASGFASTVRNGAAFIGSVLSSPFKLVGALGNTGLLFSRAQAAGVLEPNHSFGVEQWGWSLHEQVITETDPDFSLESIIAHVEPRMDELNGRYGECYDENFVLQAERPEKCTAGFLSTRDAVYWRYYNSLMFSATHLGGPV